MTLGGWMSRSAGSGGRRRTSQQIKHNVKSFLQKAKIGPKAVCISSCQLTERAVTTVTLRQPSTSSGTVTYYTRLIDSIYVLSSLLFDRLVCYSCHGSTLPWKSKFNTLKYYIA